MSVTQQPADVLIACGQGIYDNGIYYGEFNDRDVFLNHALRLPAIKDEYGYTNVVCSGGFTQAQTPHLDEAGSFGRILKDARKSPFEYISDSVALDSAENIYLGLMAARVWLDQNRPGTPIRRIGVWNAWKFKKWRFACVAETLGIIQRFYFHGFATDRDSNIKVPESMAAQPDISEYENETANRTLLLADDWEQKRALRWSKSLAEYSKRLTELRNRFPDTWNAFDQIKNIIDFGAAVYESPKLRFALRAVAEPFSREVLQPTSSNSAP